MAVGVPGGDRRSPIRNETMRSPPSTRASRWTPRTAVPTSTGVEIKPLVDGAASLVISSDGPANVGVWGRDFTMGPTVKAVRQNLVPHRRQRAAQPRDATRTTPAGLRRDPRQQRVRVAFGRRGHGRRRARLHRWPALSILALARTLQAAGAVRAMELDINTDWVSAFTYVPIDPADALLADHRRQAARRHDAQRRPVPPGELRRLLRVHE